MNDVPCVVDRVPRERPDDGPTRTGTFFGGAIREQLLAFGCVEDSRRTMDPPARLDALEDSVLVVGLDLDAFQARQRQQECVVGFGQQTADESDRGVVAERENDDGLVSRGWFAVSLERQPENRDLTVAAAQLGVERRR